MYLYLHTYTYTYIHIQTYRTYSHIHALIRIDKDIYIYRHICTEYYMHPCVCIRFTGFCLATGAPLLCSLRHAQLVPYRPWAETNELNPPPKRTRLERPARTFWKMASTDGGKMASTDGTCWILNMQHLNPLSVNILNLLCQVVEVQDAKLDTYKRIQRWWWACGCGEQSLFLDL